MGNIWILSLGAARISNDSHIHTPTHLKIGFNCVSIDPNLKRTTADDIPFSPVQRRS
jgi:hypothetical protein